jgi:hypothetical protein
MIVKYTYIMVNSKRNKRLLSIDSLRSKSWSNKKEEMSKKYKKEKLIRSELC